MSYDFYLADPVSGDTVIFDTPHDMRGGTFVVGGTYAAWLNVTYNYARHYSGFGKAGIRTIYGMTGADSIALLDKVIATLGDDVVNDYWAATEGNAKRALLHLRALAAMRPDGIWKGD